VKEQRREGYPEKGKTKADSVLETCLDQAVEHLPSKGEGLSSNLSTAKKKFYMHECVPEETSKTLNFVGITQSFCFILTEQLK
jgi:hypothetical protein